MLQKQLECQCRSDSRHGPNRIQAILPRSTRGLCIAASVDPRMAPSARCTGAHPRAIETGHLHLYPPAISTGTRHEDRGDPLNMGQPVA